MAERGLCPFKAKSESQLAAVQALPGAWRFLTLLLHGTTTPDHQEIYIATPEHQEIYIATPDHEEIYIAT